MFNKIFIALIFTSVIIGSVFAYLNFSIRNSIASRKPPVNVEKTLATSIAEEKTATAAPMVGPWGFFVETDDLAIREAMDNQCPKNAACLPIPLAVEIGEYQPGIASGVECDDGRKIGFNKETGEFELKNLSDRIMEYQTPFTAPVEWIIVPGVSDGCKFYVSSFPLQAFVDKYPDEAKKISDMSETYTVFARYMGADGFVESSKFEAERILPGERVEYRVRKDASGVKLERIGVVKDEYIVNPMTVMLAQKAEAERQEEEARKKQGNN